MKICIDPGHGGSDPGTQAFGMFEKNVNLDVGIKLKALLEHENIEVVLTRDKDDTLPPKDRIRAINESGADYMVSLHCNGGPVSAKGAETIYAYQSVKGRELAESILKEIVKLGITKRRAYYRLNAKRTDYFFIIREALPVSVIVEAAFLTNPSDNRLLSQNSFRKKIANAIAAGIFNIIELNSHQEEHWAQPYFARLKEEGLVLEEHPMDVPVNWGEFSAVVSRLLDKLSPEG